jgi:polyisoprenoid-binding protein YceI
VFALALCGSVRPGRGATLPLVVDAEASRFEVHLGRAGLLGFLGHEHTIEAPLAEGRIDADPGDVRSSRISLRFDARRLAVVPGTEPADDVDAVEARMRGPEVLDAADHPTIEFRSTAVSGEREHDGAWHLRVWGTLLLRGRPHEVTFPLVARREGGEVTAEGTIDLRLRALGIEPPKVAGVVKVADRFSLSFRVVARPAPGAETGGGEVR